MPLGTASGLLVTLTIMAVSGCAHVVVDADGTRHITGFVHLVLPPPTATPGADVLRLQTLGLSLVLHSAVGNAVILGYGDTSVTAVRNDALVSIQSGAGQPSSFRVKPESP